MLVVQNKTIVLLVLPLKGNHKFQSEEQIQKQKQKMDAQRNYVIMLMALSISFLFIILIVSVTFFLGLILGADAAEDDKEIFLSNWKFDKNEK